MSDDPVRTRVETPEGWLGFQDYFVQRRCEPAVLRLDYQGATDARPSPGFSAALTAARDAIIICPSNPYLSVDPILSLPGVRGNLASAAAPVIAVSPIVAGRAIKGPTVKIMTELGIEQTALSVARHYRGLIDGFVLDEQDQAMAEAIRAMDIAVTVSQTVMQSGADREQLAEDVLAFAASLTRTPHETTTQHAGTGSH